MRQLRFLKLFPMAHHPPFYFALQSDHCMELEPSLYTNDGLRLTQGDKHPAR